MAKARVSRALAEVRTVNSRAKTALWNLDYLKSPSHLDFMAKFHPDEEAVDSQHDEIVAVLEKVAELTEPFSREAMSGR